MERVNKTIQTQRRFCDSIVFLENNSHRNPLVGNPVFIGTERKRNELFPSPFASPCLTLPDPLARSRGLNSIDLRYCSLPAFVSQWEPQTVSVRHLLLSLEGRDTATFLTLHLLR